MPIYEYECRNCGRRIEALQKFDDAPLTTCEACDGELKKLISSPAFQFKGSGWYVTDYARKGSEGGKSAASEGSSSEGASSGDDSSSSSKSKESKGPKESPTTSAASSGSSDD